jgi:hypothetical protein
MKCKEAKTQAALLIGNDVEPAALEAVRKHLGECVGCREHLERLSNCLEVLQTPPRSWNADDESLWPKLSARLASPNAGQKPHRLNGWAPTLVVAAACAAMFWVALSHRPGPQGPVQPGGVNGVETISEPIGAGAAFDGARERTRQENELQRRRLPKNPSEQDSGTMLQPRPGAAPIEVVPVGQPAH